MTYLFYILRIFNVIPYSLFRTHSQSFTLPRSINRVAPKSESCELDANSPKSQNPEQDPGPDPGQGQGRARAEGRARAGQRAISRPNRKTAGQGRRPGGQSQWRTDPPAFPNPPPALQLHTHPPHVVKNGRADHALHRGSMRYLFNLFLCPHI